MDSVLTNRIRQKKAHKAFYWTGVCAISAFLVPHAGAGGAEYIGLHPRFLSFALITAACLLMLFSSKTVGRVNTKSKATSIYLPLCFIGLFLSVAITFPDTHKLFVLEMIGVNDYPGFKITRFLTNSLPLVFLAIFVSSAASNSSFRAGLIDGCLLNGIWSSLLCLVNSGQLVNDFHYALEANQFSSINVTLNLNMMLIGALAKFQQSRSFNNLIITAIATIIFLITAFLLAQRTGFIIAVFCLAYSARHIASQRIMSLALILISFYLGMLLLIFVGQFQDLFLLDYQHQFSRFSSLFGDIGNDASGLVRLEMWEYCFAHGIDTPLGHGVGQFAAYYPALRYPHNIFFEALYENGWLGGASVAGLLLITLATLRNLFKAQDGDVFFMGLAALTFYILKSGDLSSIGGWLFMLWLSASATTNLVEKKAVVRCKTLPTSTVLRKPIRQWE